MKMIIWIACITVGIALLYIVYVNILIRMIGRMHDRDSNELGIIRNASNKLRQMSVTDAMNEVMLRLGNKSEFNCTRMIAGPADSIEMLSPYMQLLFREYSAICFTRGGIELGLHKANSCIITYGTYIEIGKIPGESILLCRRGSDEIIEYYLDQDDVSVESIDMIRNQLVEQVYPSLFHWILFQCELLFAEDVDSE